MSLWPFVADLLKRVERYWFAPQLTCGANGEEKDWAA
jgi:hypothetical protein